MDRPMQKEQSNGKKVANDCGIVKKIERSVDDWTDKTGKALQLSKSIRSKKCIVHKDLLVISFAFFLHFTAYSGSNMLQSSINGQLGIETMMAGSICGMLSNLLLPTLVMDKLGQKWSMIVSILLRTAFPAANFFSAGWIRYLGGAISGLGAGPMWAANSVYVTWLGQRYAEISGEPADAVITRFFGFFFMFNRGAHLMSNLLSSMVLKRSKAIKWIVPSNQLINEVCASRYCYENLNKIFGRRTTNFSQSPVNNGGDNATNWTIDVLQNDTSTTFYRPSDNQLHLLFGTYVTMSLVALPLLTFLTSKSTSCDASKSSAKLGKKLLATVIHMGNAKSVLLVPYSMFVGVSYAFVLTSFSLAFITCVLGIDRLGYVMIGSAAAGVTSSFICGWLVKYTGRKAIMLLGSSLAVTSLAGMLIWSPSAHSSVFLYVLAAAWGGSTAIMHSQFPAFISIVYHNEKSKSSAYSSFILWQMVGLTVWQSVSIHICVVVQIYVLIALLIVGFLGVIIVDVIADREKKLMEEHKTTKL